jgi:hypothetical protein
MSIDLALGDVAVEIERHRALLSDLQQVILDLIEGDDDKEDAWNRVYLQEYGE